MRYRVGLVGFLVLAIGIPRTCLGWGHQGHILITRLAALRIIDDPNAPAGLKDFLKRNMPYSMAECETLAKEQTIGLHVEDDPAYAQGLDKWCTVPDVIRYTPEGKKKIEPYGAGETEMHFLDLEAFSPAFAYRDDLSGRPDVDKIPHDLADPRWKRGGFVPWRVEEMYHHLMDALGPGEKVAHPEEALEAAGYLAHYVEDSTQPHHATVDFMSASYLIGHIPQLPAMARADSRALAAMRLPRDINPHADLEFQLFENAQPPRDAFRREYWKQLQSDINVLAARREAANTGWVGPFDPFRWDLHILSDSYDYLPLIGRAAQATYAQGAFDPQTFFAFEGTVDGQKLSIVQLIALQNAKAVLDVEQVFRLAWAEAHRGH